MRETQEAGQVLRVEERGVVVHVHRDRGSPSLLAWGDDELTKLLLDEGELVREHATAHSTRRSGACLKAIWGWPA